MKQASAADQQHTTNISTTSNLHDNDIFTQAIFVLLSLPPKLNRRRIKTHSTTQQASFKTVSFFFLCPFFAFLFVLFFLGVKCRGYPAHPVHEVWCGVILGMSAFVEERSAVRPVSRILTANPGLTPGVDKRVRAENVVLSPKTTTRRSEMAGGTGSGRCPPRVLGVVCLAPACKGRKEGTATSLGAVPGAGVCPVDIQPVERVFLYVPGGR